MSKQTFHFKCYIAPLFILYLVIFSACESPVDDTTQSDTTPKTQVEFTNLEQYSATIYSDSARQIAITEVAANGTMKVAATPAPAGIAFYPTFHLDIFDMPGISVPYNAPHIMATIEDKKTAKVPIPKLESIEINSAYIKIKNNSDFPFSLRQGNTELLTLGGKNIIVMTDQNAVYEVTPGSVSSYTFMRNASTLVEFPAGLSEFKSGIIYVFTYNGTSLTLTEENSVLQTIPPSAPVNIWSEMVSSDSVRITWDAVYGATSYRIYRAISDGTYSSVGTSASASYTDTSLSVGQAYYYKISALSGTNRESAQSAAVPVIMSPGNVLWVTATTANSVSLAWNAFSRASGYNIYRSTSETGMYSKINTTAVTGTEFTDTGLSLDTAYWYKISAIIDDAESFPSIQISASTSSIPDNVRITSSDTNRIVLTWNVVSGAGGYNIYRSSSESGTYNRINTGAVTGNEFTDTNVSAYATYFYTVSTVINGIEGIQSNPVSASAGIIVPGSDLAAKLDWLQTNAVSGGGYTVEVTADEGLGPTTLLSYSGGGGTEANPALLSTNLWANGSITLTASGSAVWYSFNVTSGTTYRVWWNDSYQGSGKTLDVIVSAYYSNGTSIFTSVDSGWSSPQSFTANTSGMVKIRVTPYSSGSTGTFAVGYSTSSTRPSASSGTPAMPTNITVTLRGIGATRTVSLSSNGAMFTVSDGVTLVLDNNITLRGRSGNSNSLVRINSGGTLVMNAGSRIIGNTTSSSSTNSYGGGVYVASNGTFTMSGGEITGNSSSSNSSVSSNPSSYGGGVYVASSGTFTMSGGEISGNSSSSNSSGSSNSSYGGGVYVASSGTFTMNSGTISYNTSTATNSYNYSSSSYIPSSYGGGVYVASNGTFTMSSGTISGNTATATKTYSAASNSYSYGGGVYVTGGTLTMSGGTISGNTATTTNTSNYCYGGGVYMDKGTFSKTDGTIYGYSTSDTVNSNVVKDSSGTVVNDRGHAIYANFNSSTIKRKETTAGPTVNLSFNGTGSSATWSGEWDN